MLRANLLLMRQQVQMWAFDKEDSYCFHPPSLHDNSCGVEVWASSRRIRYDLVKLCSQNKYAWLCWVWRVWAFLGAAGTGFKIAHQWPSGPLLCSLEARWKISRRCFILSSERRSISLSRAGSLCLSLISLWKQMIYVQCSHWSLCVIPIRLAGLCARLRLWGLWAFIEATDCRTAYCRTQTILRGNAKSHQFPIPFLISSIPIWLMYIIFLNRDRLTTALLVTKCKWHVFMCTLQLN